MDIPRSVFLEPFGDWAQDDFRPDGVPAAVRELFLVDPDFQDPVVVVDLGARRETIECWVGDVTLDIGDQLGKGTVRSFLVLDTSADQLEIRVLVLDGRLGPCPGHKIS
jgi:hypothetical protein